MRPKRTFKSIFTRSRTTVLLVVVLYLLIVDSCMTMRTSTKDTRAFFQSKQVSYIDSSLTVGDSKIHYLQTGKKDGETLVFIHGSPGSWDAYMEYLADSTLLKNYRVLAPDRPGFGKSGFRKSMGLAAQAHILNTFLRKLDNGKPYTLIGHSYGGPVVVQMAVEDPELYQKLVVLAGSLDPEAEEPENWREPLTWVPFNYLIPGALKPSNEELWMLKKDLKILKPQLNQLTQPTLVIHGKEDSLVPYENVAFIKTNFTHADSLKITSLEHEDHFFIWTRKKMVVDAVVDWVSK
ncbi:MAG: alpha/beta hydrolase [Allomuricauda sp.]